MIRFTLLWIIAAIGAALTAMADAAPTPGLAGNWTFKSWTYDDCVFGGVATFRPTDNPARFDCELTARQACTGFSWQVRQSCTAHQSANRVTVTSSIEEFLEGEPTELYWPDNFILTLHSPYRMTGSLISHGVHPSEFTREPGATS